MIPTFKIRCSAIGQIMTEPRSKSESLSATAKTYLREWTLEQLFGRSKQFQTAAMRKGSEVEQAAIDFAQGQLDPDGMWFKNERHFSNDHITGTPDVINGDKVLDIKSPWSFASFPLLETELPEKAYWWQLQGYMALTECTSAAVVYCLIDAPEAIIADEARKLSYQVTAGSDWCIEAVRRQLTYPDVPDHMRIKVFEVQRDDVAIASIYDRVQRLDELAQEWLAPYADRFED